MSNLSTKLSSKIHRKIKTEVNNLIENNYKDLANHGEISDLLLGLRFDDGHLHMHYPGNEEIGHDMVRLGENYYGFTSSPATLPSKSLPLPKQIESIESEKDYSERFIVFSHRRALGDELMFTAGVRDFKLLFPHIRINIEGHHPAIWENNPYLDRSINKNDSGVEFYRVGYPVVGVANNSYIHFTHMFLLDMVANADLHRELPISLGEFCSSFANGTIGDPPLGNLKKHKHIAKEPFISIAEKYRHFCKIFSRQRGDLHLTEAEKKNNIIRDVYGVEKYWVIAPGGKRDCTCKIWDWREFQKVIDHFDGLIKFVVIGKSDLLVEKLKGTINMVDKFNKDLRGLFSLVYNSDGCVSGPSALMHIAAAIPPKKSNERKPCVAIVGGREPAWWSCYQTHQVLHTCSAYTCCKDGGCWKARTIPLQKDPKHNTNLCRKPVKVDGKSVPECMASITYKDIIRSIERYYEGDIYHYSKPEKKLHIPEVVTIEPSPKMGKEINLLGNLNTDGGGEQSFLMVAKLLREAGWKVNIHPCGSVHRTFEGTPGISKYSFEENMDKYMRRGIPLLFYANDRIRDFINNAEKIVANSSSVVIGINYINDKLPSCRWLSSTGKLKAVIFQNEEKKSEFERDRIGFEDTKQIVLFGAIDLNKHLELCPPKREKNDELVILKHCKADYRKYVTYESEKSGDKIHLWQQKIIKENDVKFYGRLLKATKNVKFEFMEAHPQLVEAFKKEKRMVFHKWNSMDVGKFLERGHLYLYRTSNMWRDNYPRCLAEALAAGLPALVEPRDGCKDRVIHGNTGLYCIDYDAFLYGIKLLQRKEDYRHTMGMNAKDWARESLDPRGWITILEEILNVK